MKTFDTQNKLKENEDYELITGAGENWDVRLLTGPFPETVVTYGQLQVSEDGEYLNFNFDLVSSPDPELTEDNVDLQLHVGQALNSILESAVTRQEDEDKK